ncbi:hypothetical protein GLOIN_2v1777142 [Rhizophagus irregularis DAOM 181602=DAOM 197198]|nr:hypothetical protein GLOIN_2v1777142 [Rhizophagus irregularis DAOM 181602=DAOM 197198]CAG8619067.1 6450_t:CDS:2 [Rhizophagus irregularis]
MKCSGIGNEPTHTLLHTVYYLNSSSSATSHNNITASGTSMSFSSTDNRQEESKLCYYV